MARRRQRFMWKSCSRVPQGAITYKIIVINSSKLITRHISQPATKRRRKEEKKLKVMLPHSDSCLRRCGLLMRVGFHWHFSLFIKCCKSSPCSCFHNNFFCEASCTFFFILDFRNYQFLSLTSRWWWHLSYINHTCHARQRESMTKRRIAEPIHNNLSVHKNSIFKSPCFRICSIWHSIVCTRDLFASQATTNKGTKWFLWVTCFKLPPPRLIIISWPTWACAVCSLAGELPNVDQSACKNGRLRSCLLSNSKTIHY
jgi:hypothetical protein